MACVLHVRIYYGLLRKVYASEQKAKVLDNQIPDSKNIVLGMARIRSCEFLVLLEFLIRVHV